MISLIPRPNRKEGLDAGDYCDAARRLDVAVSRVRAVDAVESAGRGFLPSGRPKILFEGHLFHKFTYGKYSKTHPTISYANWTKKFYKGGEAEYVRLQAAMQLDPRAALRAASFSRFQILGDNYRACGFSSVEEFVEAMFADEDNSLEAFVNFVRSRNLSDELRTGNFIAFARGYNGPAYFRNEYHTKLRNADKTFAKQRFDCSTVSGQTIDAVMVAECFDECVGTNNTSLDNRYLNSPSVESDSVEANDEQNSSQNPTVNPPTDSSTTSNLETSSADQAGTSTTEGGGPTGPPLTEKLDSALTKVTQAQDKIDVVSNAVSRIDTFKTLLRLAGRWIVRAVAYLIALAVAVPVEYWVIAAIVGIIAALIYIYRKPIWEFYKRLRNKS